jgi:hypothetical protein
LEPIGQRQPRSVQSSSCCRRLKIQIWRFVRAAAPLCLLTAQGFSPRRVAITRTRQQSRPAGRRNLPPQGHAPTLSRSLRGCWKTEAPMGPIRRSRKRKSEPEPAAESEARGGKPVRSLVRAGECLRTSPQSCASVPQAHIRTPPQSRAGAPQSHQVRERRRQLVPRRVYRFLADLSSSDSVSFVLFFHISYVVLATASELLESHLKWRR